MEDSGVPVQPDMILTHTHTYFLSKLWLTTESQPFFLYCLISIKEEITEEKLHGVKLWITGGPREKFTEAEVK